MNLKFVFLICSVLTLVNCTSIGTRILPKNREGFAGAMIVSDEQQLLLNIVREQFEDRPVFINVDSITTSNNLSSQVSGDFSYSSSPNRLSDAPPPAFSDTFSLTHGYSLSPNVSYSDTPTITFTPLQGEAWMRHILKPMTLEDVYLLLASEWSPQKVMRIAFERIFTMYNESKFFDTGTPKVPDNKRFMEFTQLLNYLVENHMIYFSTSKIDHVLLPPGVNKVHFEDEESYG
jgi:hypothetical protein